MFVISCENVQSNKNKIDNAVGIYSIGTHSTRISFEGIKRTFSTNGIVYMYMYWLTRAV